MRNFTKTLLLSLFTGTLCSHAQTNVSGGIYSNTTWTKANSPYIVTSNIVVFPNYTLTIEPGVTVKFADQVMLEIRMANIIAEGTATDSITFTSNSPSPYPGIWNKITVSKDSLPSKFNYCNFQYATIGVEGGIASLKNSNLTFNVTGANAGGTIDTCNFRNNTQSGLRSKDCICTSCQFSNNNYGFGGSDLKSSGFFKNCTISSNQTGAGLVGGSMDSCTITNNINGITFGVGGTHFKIIRNSIISFNSVTGINFEGGGYGNIFQCQVNNNGTGIIASMYGGDSITMNDIEYNAIGIKLYSGGGNIYCNKLCNNTSFDFYNNKTSPCAIPNNYWCTTDSARIRSHIYDGYDNVSLGLVTFMPIDTEQCSHITGLVSSIRQSFNIFPNPASDYLNIYLLNNSLKSTLKIFSLLGELVYTTSLNRQRTELDISFISNGIYVIEVANTTGNFRQKFVKN